MSCLQFLVALPPELVDIDLLAAPVRLALVAGVSYLPLAGTVGCCQFVVAACRCAGSVSVYGYVGDDGLICVVAAAAIDALDTLLAETGSSVPSVLQDVLPLVGRLLDTRNLSSVDIAESDKARAARVGALVK